MPDETITQAEIMDGLILISTIERLQEEWDAKLSRGALIEPGAWTIAYEKPYWCNQPTVVPDKEFRDGAMERVIAKVSA